ncbi:MAG: GNAT family N-acetyltransferase, partial [Alphaproteobacteria bacterium]
PIMQDIERDAGRRFAETPFSFVATAEPTSGHTISLHLRTGFASLAWHDRRPVGFILARLEEGAGYVAELSVRCDWGRRGCGRALMAAAESWLAEQGADSAWLTTFTDIPWNAPWYADQGYQNVVTADRPAWLNRIMDRQALDDRLDPVARSAMVKSLPPDTDRDQSGPAPGRR